MYEYRIVANQLAVICRMTSLYITAAFAVDGLNPGEHLRPVSPDYAGALCPVNALVPVPPWNSSTTSATMILRPK
jgi:hypothetical protein